MSDIIGLQQGIGNLEASRATGHVGLICLLRPCLEPTLRADLLEVPDHVRHALDRLQLLTQAQRAEISQLRQFVLVPPALGGAGFNLMISGHRPDSAGAA